MPTQNNTHLQALKDAAKLAASNAYAPYSNFQVGAAVLTANEKIVKGCNVENASYGLTTCAERNCIAQAVVEGERKLKTIVIYTEQEKLTPPCGACRQVIAEFLTADAEVISTNHLEQTKVWSVSELLPDAFTPQDLLE